MLNDEVYIVKSPTPYIVAGDTNTLEETQLLNQHLLKLLTNIPLS